MKLGYKTVLQDSALVYTDAPTDWRTFTRQQLRWSAGSQYNNLNYLSCMILKSFGVAVLGVIYTGPVWLLPVLIIFDDTVKSGGIYLQRPPEVEALDVKPDILAWFDTWGKPWRAPRPRPLCGWGSRR